MARHGFHNGTEHHHAGASMLTAKPVRLERSPDNVRATPATCGPARDLQGRMRRVCDILLTVAAFPGRVETTNAYECDLRTR